MFLVDTNIWLERLLDQEKSNDVKVFLDKTPLENIYITDFTLHSIGVILEKLKKMELFIRFVKDLFEQGNLTLLSLHPRDMKYAAKAVSEYRLDFDDAYQYAVAEINALQLISFDKDFDKTKRGRKQPDEVVN